MVRVLTRECEVVSGEGAYESGREWVVRVLTSVRVWVVRVLTKV